MIAFPRGRVRRIARLGLVVADLDRARRFYAALGFAAEPVARLGADEGEALGLPGAGGERLTMRLGAQVVEAVRFDRPGRPYPADGTATDLWFQHFAIAVADMEGGQARALAAGAAPITRGGPQSLPANAGGVAAWKFRDPDGHPLELLRFPPGRGDPAWQDRGGPSPFLGIDHTAIAVGDAGRSLTFYAALGFEAAEGSRNAGPEQERLDDVAGDRVRVVPLAPPRSPPHLELLAYEAGARRPMPADTRADDVWATRTVLESDGAGADALVRDPDGHRLAILAEDGDRRSRPASPRHTPEPP